MKKILSVKNPYITFRTNEGKVHAICGVDFDLPMGKTLTLIGESDSGETTIGCSMIRLYYPTASEITFNYEKISGTLSNKTSRMLRKNIQMIFQDPMSSLNPRKKSAT